MQNSALVVAELELVENPRIAVIICKFDGSHV
jgi:hypothetical protein